MRHVAYGNGYGDLPPRGRAGILRGMTMTNDSAAAVHVRGLTRSFQSGKRGARRETQALRGIDLTIPRGHLYGVLGPNGAGKTTLMKILTTLLAPTSGEVHVAGFDAVRQARDVRRRIGLVSGGDNAGYGILTVRETLWMFSQFYGVPTRVARERGEVLLDALGLREKADERVNRLSTGYKQRLNFARGFISEPEIVFLDEPTLGLDVASARQIRQFLRGWMAAHADRTIVLTTHYMAEADELCETISIIDHGRILETDSPLGLRTRVHAQRTVTLECDAADDVHAVLASTPGLDVQRVSAPNERGTVTAQLAVRENAAVGAVLERLTHAGRTVHNVTTRDPSLEDVFVAIVGREMDAEGNVVGDEDDAR